MIRKERFGAEIEAFASERKSVLTRAEEMLEQSTRMSLVRVGLPNWYGTMLEEMLNVFDFTVKMETDQSSPVILDMRAEFERQISESLDKAKKGTNPEAQFERLLRWAANASVNAGVEAATTADPDENVGVEWVTMADEDVRSSHKELHGSQVPTGQTFEVGGEELLYPGQPVGDPAVWINCRCVIRAAMLGGYASSTQSFANASDPTAQGDDPSAVIVALPRKGDPIYDLASGDFPHTTLVYLGKVDAEGVKPELEAVAELIPKLMTDKVSGRANLGEDKADVLLLDASATSIIREALLNQPVIEQLFKESETDQFPHWIPHTTIGYPDAPAQGEEIPEDVTYDRIAYWRGEEMIEVSFKLGDEIVDETPEPVTASADVDEDVEVDEEAPEINEDDFDTQVPWHGVLAPEGVPSGDGRQFAVEALRNRELPIPLKAQPADEERHGGSVVVGRIDRIFRENGLVKAEGVFDTSAYAYEVIRQIANSMLRGVSVDVDDVSGAMQLDGDDDQQIIEFGSARIAAATIVAIPAFAEAFVALGRWDDEKVEDQYDIAPPKTRDGKGWITDPKPTQKITGYWVDGRGAAKIGWGKGGDFARCERQLRKYVKNPQWLAGLCANLHYRALGVWPGQHGSLTAGGAEATSPSVNLVASADQRVSANYFRQPDLTEPSPITVTEDGHVFGHVAAWGTCHIGFKDTCVTPPNSTSKYAYFLTGEVLTDAGAVAVGQISLGGGHASLKKGLVAAISHYDQTSTAVADVTAGEDAFGIWVSGKIRDGVTEKQISDLRASALSGDWRGIRGGLEMVAALAVNVPGFPIPRPSLAASGAGQTSLVASGIVPPKVNAIADEVGTSLSQDKIEAFDNARKMFRSLRLEQMRQVFK